jgi:gas vesicle protein
MREESGNRLGWFLTGLMIGTAAGILYAPKSGKETRRFLNDKSQEAGETGKEFADAGREMFERGRKLVEDAAELFERGRQLVKG